MGNYCYFPEEMRNYKRAKKEIDDNNKNFIWGADRLERSCFLFVDLKSQKLCQVKVPNKIRLFNLCGSLQLDENRIAICGGVSNSMREISSKFLIYHIKENIFVQNRSMINIRFNFPLIFLKGKLYALGGRHFGGNDVAIRSECECFDFTKKKWEKIPNMHIARSSCQALVYRGNIWVIGGNNPNRLGETIEFFDVNENKWVLIDLNLPFDYFNHEILSVSDDKILIIGGYNSNSDNRNIHEVDLKEKTILSKGKLLNKRISFNMFHDKNKNKIYIITATHNSFHGIKNFQEVIDLNNFQTSTFNLIYRGSLNNIDLELFRNNKRQVNVKTDENLRMDKLIIENENNIYYSNNNNKNLENINYIFGTDNEPFQIEINKINLEIKTFPIKWDLRLKNHQGVIRIKIDELFFAGGVNYSFNRVYNNCFTYNLITKKIKSVNSMLDIRFSFSIKFFKGEIYALGGRTYGNNDESILSDCEKYNIEKKKWINIGALNESRCQTSCFVIKNKLFISGGLAKSGDTLQSIEVLNEKKNRWELFGSSLSIGLMGFISFPVDEDKVLFFGGCGNNAKKKCGILDLKFGGDLSSWECKNLLKSHSLPKCAIVQDKLMLFGGLSNDLELYDFKQNKVVYKNNVVLDTLSSHLKKVNHAQYFLSKGSYVLANR